MKFLKMNKKTIQKGIRQSLILVYALLVLIFCYILLFGVISSVQYQQSFGEPHDTLSVKSPGLSEMKKQTSFLNARYSLVKDDSISLIVNLHDSTIILELKGVPLHEAKITTISSSKIFKRIDPDVLSRVLSAPLQMKEQYATIPKIKFNIMVSPVGSTSVEQTVSPENNEEETICYLFELENGILLDVRQAGVHSGKQYDGYNRKVSRLNTLRIARDLMAFRVPEFKPVIRIEVPEKDAKTIYKALPLHAKVALTL
jgi:hypothetical protein